ncbi:MAG: hypothetical protein WCV71_03140 [Patescibacteria group bacterium]
MSLFISQFLLAIIFLTIVFLHGAKKNMGAVLAYRLQSLAVVAFTFSSFLETRDILLLIVCLVIFIVKVIFAPMFLARLIKKHKLTYSVSSYLNAPLTLIMIAIFTAIAYSQKFVPLTNLMPGHQTLLHLALASIFLSLFLIVNRKGVLSQIIGVLSLENSIVTFVFYAGLEQSHSLQLGILFDIFIWIIIAIVFMSMIYRHYDSLDVSRMKQLKD